MNQEAEASNAIIYRVRLKLLSGFMTRWQADTVFGHICWSIAHREGDSALKQFLEPFIEGEPPFVISNGFVGDLLPLPLSYQSAFSEPSDTKKKMELSQKLRELRAKPFVTLSQFDKVRQLEPFDPVGEESGIQTELIPHAQISRLTGTTPAEGGLFELEEFSVSPEQHLSIYVRAIDADSETIQIRFEDLAEVGFGKKKSAGKGQFEVQAVEEFGGFVSVANANGFVTLSNFVPQEGDPAEGRYELLVKFGKLGEEFAHSRNPFKKPLVMMKAGSVFHTHASPMRHYGGMVRGLSVHQEVVQYAYAFSLPIRYPEPAGVMESE